MLMTAVRRMCGSKAARIFLALQLLMLASFVVFGWENTWAYLDFDAEPLQPHFIDLRTIQAAPEAMARGLDPLVENPTDPAQRKMNYPRIWAYAAQYVHLSDLGVTIAGSVFWALYIVSVLILIDSCDPRPAGRAMTAVLALMPASWFVLHNGNNDLLILFLVVVCCRLFATRMGTALSALAFAVVLKIYPIVLFPLFLYRTYRKTANIAVVCAFALSAVYILFQVADLNLIRTGNNASAQHSYGFGSLWMLPAILPSHQAVMWPMNATSERIFFLIFALAGAGIAARGFFSLRALDDKNCEPLLERFFITGAALYTGTFILSNNWDYRLVLLVLCGPYLATMPALKRNLTLWAMVVTMNYWSISSIGQTLSGASSRVAFILLIFVQLAKILLFGLLMHELGQRARRRLAVPT